MNTTAYHIRNTGSIKVMFINRQQINGQRQSLIAHWLSISKVVLQEQQCLLPCIQDKFSPYRLSGRRAIWIFAAAKTALAAIYIHIIKEKFCYSISCFLYTFLKFCGQCRCISGFSGTSIKNNNFFLIVTSLLCEIDFLYIWYYNFNKN